MEITKEILENFYINHSTNDTTKYFNISKKELIEILDEYNIQPHTKQENISFTLLNKTEEQKNQTELKRKRTNQLRYGCDNVSQVKNISDKISNTIRNFTSEQRQHRLDSFHNTLNLKSEEERRLITKHKSEATKKYFENLSVEQRNAFSTKMSEVYKNLSEEQKKERSLKIANSYKEACMKKYGVDNCLKLDSIKEKIIQTNNERYGVPYYCMTNNCRNSLGGNSSLSKPNLKFRQLLEDNNINYITEFVLDNFSYDFKVGNILIEINPYITHNSTYSPFNTPKEKSYHRSKSLLAKEYGFKCIHVWDWDDLNKIIFLIKDQDKIYARKCLIKEIDINIAKEFLNTYHIQNYVKSEIQLGLYHNNELISLMTFGKPRYNKNYEVELLRYVTVKKVVGGAEKLFRYYIDKYNPSSIISYCDESKFIGKLYEKLGFIYKGFTISKHWYNPKDKKHITDNLLRQRGADQLLGTSYGKGTNNEIILLENGFVEIWDAGQATYIWEKN